MPEPEPIGDAIEHILSGILPDLLAEFRALILHEHTETVRALRDAVQTICARRLREVAGELTDRFSNTTAAQMAGLQLEPEFVLLRQELQEQLDVLEDELRQRMRRLLDWWKTTDRNPETQDRAS